MPTVLIVLLIAGGENVTMKLRSIAIGMTTGTIGSTAIKGGYKATLCWRDSSNILGGNSLTPADK